jgi:hypothetical protein
MRSFLISFVVILIVSLVSSVDWYMKPLAFLPTLIRPSYFKTNTTAFIPASSFFTTSTSTSTAIGSHNTMGRTREPASTTSPGGKTDAELTDREKKEWNHLANMMERYHDHFKHSFHAIYQVSHQSVPRLGPLIKV